jgi:hypothetical protein
MIRTRQNSFFRHSCESRNPEVVENIWIPCQARNDKLDKLRRKEV